MYNIFFYRNAKGEEPVAEYLAKLNTNSKDDRIKLNKIRDYVKALSLYGESLGMPYIKHIDGPIWELRPLRDRIFFVAWEDNSFYLLHVFRKKTRKTPKREINKAMREYQEIVDGEDNEKQGEG